MIDHLLPQNASNNKPEKYFVKATNLLGFCSDQLVFKEADVELVEGKFCCWQMQAIQDIWWTGNSPSSNPKVRQTINALQKDAQLSVDEFLGTLLDFLPTTVKEYGGILRAQTTAQVEGGISTKENAVQKFLWKMSLLKICHVSEPLSCSCRHDRNYIFCSLNYPSRALFCNFIYIFCI